MTCPPVIRSHPKPLPRRRPQAGHARSVYIVLYDVHPTTVKVTVNGAAGVVAITNGRPFAVMGFTVAREKIVEIDCLLDPERLARLDPAPRDRAS